MRPVTRQEGDDSQLLFLPAVFNETLGLLFDAHHYFQVRGRDEQARLNPLQRPVYAQEMSKITLRLTSVMAWIMVRRAVHSGSIEGEKAAHDYRLDGSDVCLSDLMPDDLPYYIGYLADRSLNLYERVWRLDQLAYGTQH